MILAAGLGTRLRPYSLSRPKPLFPVIDRPLLSLIIDQLRQAGFGPIVVNAHHLSNQVRTLLAPEKDVFIQVEDAILGTGGGIRKAMDYFDDAPVLIVNGDTYHTIDLARVYRRHIESGALATLVLHDFPRFNTVSVNDDGCISGFGREITSLQGSLQQLAFTGIHVIEPSILEKIPRDIFYSIIDCYRECIRDGESVRGLCVRDHFWSDMGTVNDYLDLHAFLLQEKKNTKRVSAFGSCFYIGEDVRLSSTVQLNDWVSIGSGARIGEEASLARVVVWDNAEVAPGTVLQDTIVI